MDNSATEKQPFTLMPGSETDWVHRVCPHHDGRLNDSLEFKEAKEALASRVQALIGSIEVAIARLQGQQGGNHADAAKRIDLYQTALGQGRGLLTALGADGGHQLANLSERAEVISSAFLEVADGSIPDDASGEEGSNAPAKLVRAAAVSKEEMDKQIAGDAFMQSLVQHQNKLENLKVANNALVDDIASSAADGKRDLDATIRLAGMIASNASADEKEKFLAATLRQMAETEISSAGASIEDRYALILREAGEIARSTKHGEAAARKSIAGATHAIMELHLGSHAAETKQHLGEIGNQMAACLIEHYCDTCSSQSAAWHAHMDETMAKLDAAVHAMGRGATGSNTPVSAKELERIVAGMDTDRVFRLWREQGDRGAELLKNHGATLEQAAQGMLVTQAKLDSMLRGASGEGAGDVALVLGVSKEDLMAHVKEFNATPASIASQIDGINDAWIKNFFYPKIGQALDLNNN